jgi:hypothetical protein
MFGPRIPAVREEFVGDCTKDNVPTLPAGRKPIGTCDILSKRRHYPYTRFLHSIGSFRERLNNQIFILVPPSPHRLL